MNRRIYLTSVFHKNRWNVFVHMVVHLSIEKCCIQPKATLIRDKSKKSDSEKTECLILAVFLKLTLYGRYIDDCISATSALPQRYLNATSSTKEELTHFITTVSSFHPALKYTREISETSLLFSTSKFQTKFQV